MVRSRALIQMENVGSQFLSLHHASPMNSPQNAGVSLVQIAGVRSLPPTEGVTTGMIANIESPLDTLAQPRKKGKKPQQKAPQRNTETTSPEQPPA